MLYTLWALNAAEQDKLGVFGRRAQQIALRRQCPNSITNEELATRTQMPPLLHIWSQQAVRYAGHIVRMPHERLTRKVFLLHMTEPNAFVDMCGHHTDYPWPLDRLTTVFRVKLSFPCHVPYSPIILVHFLTYLQQDAAE